jgi:hypothetical protein
MKSREEAPQCFVDFCSIAENFSQQTITILRVDNAPELISGKLHAFCKTRGITYEKTVLDSPNQNGVAERCNLTLGSMVRALLIDADLSYWFWPFAVQTAVHIKNRVPHSSLPPHTTPFQLWHQRKPNLSHLRLFGAHCTSRILPTPQPKFAPRGESGRFLGYAMDAKGYLIWVTGPNGRGGSVKIRRDVTFHGFPSVENSDHSLLWDEVALPEKLGKPPTMYALFIKRFLYPMSHWHTFPVTILPALPPTIVPLQGAPMWENQTTRPYQSTPHSLPYGAPLAYQSDLVVPNGRHIFRLNLTIS